MIERIIILGAAGFIGTNLVKKLVSFENVKITVVDKREDYFKEIRQLDPGIIDYVVDSLEFVNNYDEIVKGQDTVYHLVSTSIPTTSNQNIADELLANVVFSSKLLDACVRQNVKKVVFISSGGTVYGKEITCPISEDTETNPISSYGVQKITIEKLLYLYNYLYGLDYRIVRLANPYGPHQRPNGMLGAVTTFIYKTLQGEKITVYGDGSIIRDYIYIDNAIDGILNISNGTSEQKVFNLGTGKGTSIQELLNLIESVLGKAMKIEYTPKRNADVPINYLDMSRYERSFGKLQVISLEEGIKETAEYLSKQFCRSLTRGKK